MDRFDAVGVDTMKLIETERCIGWCLIYSTNQRDNNFVAAFYCCAVQKGKREICKQLWLLDLISLLLQEGSAGIEQAKSAGRRRERIERQKRGEKRNDMKGLALSRASLPMLILSLSLRTLGLFFKNKTEPKQRSKENSQL
jgi:hypothetical protein